jgi:hypothetical protein
MRIGYENQHTHTKHMVLFTYLLDDSYGSKEIIEIKKKIILDALITISFKLYVKGNLINSQ